MQFVCAHQNFKLLSHISNNLGKGEMQKYLEDVGRRENKALHRVFQSGKRPKEASECAEIILTYVGKEAFLEKMEKKQTPIHLICKSGNFEALSFVIKEFGENNKEKLKEIFGEKIAENSYYGGAGLLHEATPFLLACACVDGERSLQCGKLLVNLFGKSVIGWVFSFLFPPFFILKKTLSFF